MTNLDTLKTNPLFKGLSDDQLNVIFTNFKKTTFDKNEYIFNQTDKIDKIYILLKGKIEISTYDLDATKNIITILERNSIFAESIALSSNNISPYNAKSLEPSFIAYISKEEFLKISYKNEMLYHNILSIMANKNIFFSFKLQCLSKKTIEKKLFELLKYYSILQNSHNIILPYNKTQLAEFLFVNRSALSTELSKMEKKGIFKFSNNVYILNKKYFI